MLWGGKQEMVYPSPPQERLFPTIRSLKTTSKSFLALMRGSLGADQQPYLVKLFQKKEWKTE